MAQEFVMNTGLLFAGALAAFSLTTAAHADRPFTAKDLASMDRVSNPKLSPDGHYVVYDLRTVDFNANKSTHSLWLIDLTKAGDQPRRLAASDGGATDPYWSPDGKSIYFASSRSSGNQIWRTDPSGAQALQVTSLPLDVGAFRVAPDGKHIVLSAAVFPDCDTMECSKSRLDAKAASKTTGVLYDRLFVRHWDE
jgi:dipeptidyl aminopeptidase/acylaminoacyl peptidase